MEDRTGNTTALLLRRGSFLPTEKAPEAPSRLIITTFNIRYAVGSFLISGSLFRRAGLSRPARRERLVARNIINAARALSGGLTMPAADFIALQEADHGTLRAGRHDIAAELAMSLKMAYAHAALGRPGTEQPRDNRWYLDFEEPISLHDEGDTGIAVLSRFPFLESRRIDLPWSDCAWRPRTAIAAVISAGSHRLHFYNAHIDPHASISQRIAQHEAILNDVSSSTAGDPVVLLGDFNTLTSASRVAMRNLLESNGFVTPIPTGIATWRAGLVRLHTDWIFIRGVSALRWGIARPLSVSDHWPVWLEIALKQ